MLDEVMKMSDVFLEDHGKDFIFTGIMSHDQLEE